MHERQVGCSAWGTGDNSAKCHMNVCTEICATGRNVHRKKSQAHNRYDGNCSRFIGVKGAEQTEGRVKSVERLEVYREGCAQ